MLLYGKITSERASKGQGGKLLDIEITDKNNTLLWTIQVRDNNGWKIIRVFNEINKRKSYKYDDIYPNELKAKGKSQKGECDCNMNYGTHLQGSHDIDCNSRN